MKGEDKRPLARQALLRGGGGRGGGMALHVLGYSGGLRREGRGGGASANRETEVSSMTEKLIEERERERETGRDRDNH